jgi:hypothetical protein
MFAFAGERADETPNWTLESISADCDSIWQPPSLFRGAASIFSLKLSYINLKSKGVTR